VIWCLWILDGETWTLAGEFLDFSTARSSSRAFDAQGVRAIVCREGADPVQIAARSERLNPEESP
jgi:hypothetical protein